MYFNLHTYESLCAGTGDEFFFWDSNLFHKTLKRYYEFNQ